jgi:hypothetical protein
MTTGITAICAALGGTATKPQGAIARLAPDGQHRPRDRFARHRPAGEPAGWQRILDLLDPGKRCGAWCPATLVGHPVVCTRAPHDALEQHLDAETGWRW